MRRCSLCISLSIIACAGETPLAAYLRERREYAESRGWELPKGREGRREVEMIAADCQRGEDAAMTDLEQGIYGVAHFGLPADCHSRYSYEAWRRYEVQHRWMGCMIDSHNAPYADCYNHVMGRAIEQAHGAGVLDDLRAEICDRATPRGTD